MERALAKYERLLEGEDSPEQAASSENRPAVEGALGGVSLDDSMTGLTASVNQLTLLVNDHTQRRQQEAAAQERIKQAEEALLRTQRRKEDTLQAINQRQDEFQQVIAHRRHLRESPSPGKGHLACSVATPNMSPQRRLDHVSNQISTFARVGHVHCTLCFMKLQSNCSIHLHQTSYTCASLCCADLISHHKEGFNMYSFAGCMTQ